MPVSRRAHWLLLAVVSVIVLVGAVALALLTSREGTEAPCESVLGLTPADVDGDGRSELLVLHRADAAGTGSLLEAIELESGAVLWQRLTVPTDAAPSAEVPLLVVDAERVYVTSRTSRGAQPSRVVAAHELATGAPLWTWALPEGEEWNVSCRLALVGSLVLAMGVRETESQGRLTALEPRSGEVVWQAEVGAWPGRPFQTAGALLVPTLDGAFLIDPETGETSHAPWVRAAWQVGDETLAVHDGVGGYVLGELAPDASFTPRARGDGGVIELPPGANPQLAVALYREHTLLAGAAVGADALGLEALPITAGGRAWELDFEERFGLLVRNDSWRRVSPAESGFVRIEHPFAPAILSRELDPTHDRGALAILDLEQGRVAWQSRPMAQRPPGFWPRSIMQRDGRYLVSLPLVEDLESVAPGRGAGAVLVVEGRSGRVAHAWQLVDPAADWVFPSPGVAPLPWGWRPPLLYGSDGRRVWAVDLDAGRVVWSRPAGLVLRDVRGEVEARLGELPR